MEKNKAADEEKIIMSISLDVATKKRLRKLAKAKHVTMSGLISAWVWSQEIPKRDDTEDDGDE